jgi:hypothetical protein
MISFNYERTAAAAAAITIHQLTNLLLITILHILHNLLQLLLLSQQVQVQSSCFEELQRQKLLNHFHHKLMLSLCYFIINFNGC